MLIVARGKHRPRPEYQRLIASALGSVSAAIFGPDAQTRHRLQTDLLVLGDDNTLEHYRQVIEAARAGRGSHNAAERVPVS